MTRAFLFIGHGDIRSALELNVNSVAVFGIMVGLWFQSAFRIVTGREIKVHFVARESNLIAGLAVVAMVFGWIHNLSR